MPLLPGSGTCISDALVWATQTLPGARSSPLGDEMVARVEEDVAGGPSRPRWRPLPPTELLPRALQGGCVIPVTVSRRPTMATMGHSLHNRAALNPP